MPLTGGRSVRDRHFSQCATDSLASLIMDANRICPDTHLLGLTGCNSTDVLGASSIFPTSGRIPFTLPIDSITDQYETTSTIPSWVFGDRLSEVELE